MADGTGSLTVEFVVTGMTCGHCVQAVTDEIATLDGVETVTVDLESGRVMVVSSAPVTRDEVAAAVDEAGYELAG
ncbi:MAG: copper ion binding protein [Actinomycetes bacterium]